MIYLGAEHGASKQEVLSLKWSDINFDFNDGIGLIRFYRTKNGMERTETLMPRTKEALLSWKNHLENRRKKVGLLPNQLKSDNVFCSTDGKPLKRFDKSWRTSIKTAAFEGFHFHDLRHTFASNLILSGSDIKDVKEMIGHSDISMTDRYSHLTTAYKFIRQQKLAEHYSAESVT